mmetsp:Transcript_4163/g.11947  ORF Transcript_4163/g.11947 Transcript_4163/m.11947 type:complete len:255 (+) Transcript_4163:841-1605(+)
MRLNRRWHIQEIRQHVALAHAAPYRNDDLVARPVERDVVGQQPLHDVVKAAIQQLVADVHARRVEDGLNAHVAVHVVRRAAQYRVRRAPRAARAAAAAHGAAVGWARAAHVRPHMHRPPVHSDRVLEVVQAVSEHVEAALGVWLRRQQMFHTAWNERLAANAAKAAATAAVAGGGLLCWRQGRCGAGAAMCGPRARRLCLLQPAWRRRHAHAASVVIGVVVFVVAAAVVAGVAICSLMPSWHQVRLCGLVQDPD